MRRFSTFMPPVENKFTPVQTISQKAGQAMAFNLKYQVNVEFQPSTDLTHFSEKLLASEGNDVRTVEFFTITGARIPLCE